MIYTQETLEGDDEDKVFILFDVDEGKENLQRILAKVEEYLGGLK